MARGPANQMSMQHAYSPGALSDKPHHANVGPERPNLMNGHLQSSIQHYGTIQKQKLTSRHFSIPLVPATACGIFTTGQFGPWPSLWQNWPGLAMPQPHVPCSMMIVVPTPTAIHVMLQIWDKYAEKYSVSYNAENTKSIQYFAMNKDHTVVSERNMLPGIF